MPKSGNTKTPPASEGGGNTKKNTGLCPPWKPGQSGNPNGRPKMSPEERAAWKALSTKARARLEEMVDDPETQPNIVAKIAEIATNRAYGTPTQAVELSGPDGGPMQFADLSDDEIDARLKALKALG